MNSNKCCLKGETVMKTLMILLICLIFHPWAASACDKCEVVVKVIDGDSVVIQQDGTVRTVHLVSIDAPQLEQPYGDKAKAFTEDLLLNRVVAIQYIDKRQASDIVSFDGKSLKWGLIRSGYAWYPKNHEKGQLRSLNDPLAKQERKIRRKRVGLWADANPQPPWGLHRGSEVIPSVIGSFSNCTLGSANIVG
jgi:micrococcal nuclease